MSPTDRSTDSSRPRPYDPHSKLQPASIAYLDAIWDLGLPECVYMGTRPTLSAPELRAVIDEGRSRIPKSEPLPMWQVDDVKVPGGDDQLGLRVYRPTEEIGLPVLIYFHGGGWVLGGLDSHDGVCRELASQAECVVVAVDYRRAPEAKYPAAVDDAVSALEWVRSNVAQYGGDPTRVAVGGDSAGGNLSTVLSAVNLSRGGSPLAFQLLVYPVTDFDFETPSYGMYAEGYHLGRGIMEWFHDMYLDEPSQVDDPWVSPLRARDLSGLPPALVITAECDPLRDEGRAYADRLSAAGVPVKYLEYEGMIHSFYGFGPTAEASRDAVMQSAAALRSAFATYSTDD